MAAGGNPSISLTQGSVIWATVSPPVGQPKQRPLVVITPDEEIRRDEPIVAVAISTSVDSSDANVVALPWSQRQPPPTGLRKRSFAVCNWLVELRPSDVVSIQGRINKSKLCEILELVRRLKT
ncbi:MAG: type II toxin-antitoxin system PemK/MazF family toxin [Phycisphaeraceae bacterium]|nr:type II toxin-antitoxin system PemK/MazF family toxin [Phycisphaeraceae bacterium]